MTPQEKQLIDGLVDRIRNTPVTEKDPEADGYLHQQLDRVPDSLYVLAQTVLVQQYGLDNAQRQIADLQQQLEQAQAQPKKSGSFLSHLLGTDQPQQAPPPQPQYQPVNQGYTPPPPPPPGYAPVSYGQPVGYGSGGGGGFLRGALQTAAGVAAGEMVFQGMEGLFHGFGGGGGYGERPTEVIENNYYNDDRGEHEHHAADTSDSGSFYNPDNDASRQGLSPDIEDRRGFADTADDSSVSNDDDSNDNSSDSFSDGGGFDSSDSGYDDGGGDFGSGGDDNSF